MAGSFGKKIDAIGKRGAVDYKLRPCSFHKEYKLGANLNTLQVISQEVNVTPQHNSEAHHVVIIGGGFGGLYAAKALRRSPVKVTVLDKRNFHLFQPLLYQVATGSLSPGDIASPIRGVLAGYKNIQVLLAEVKDIEPKERKVILDDEELTYDTLVVATGVSHAYFGHNEWQKWAPGLKTVEDAREIRRRILLAFEEAEKEQDLKKRDAWLTFVLIGGGTTGVELAGALADIAHNTLKNEFINIDPTQAKIILLQGNERLLPTYHPELSTNAKASLERLGVTVRTGTRVTNIEEHKVTLSSKDGHTEEIQAQTILWAAGVQASPMGQVLESRTGVKRDSSGRIMVNPDFTIPDDPNIFVIGDLANFSYGNEEPLPGVAPVAMQEGAYVAKLIQRRLVGKSMPAFHYVDRGSLAVIGRNAAVVDLGFIRLQGFPAWVIWSFIHIYFLVGFDDRLMVFIQWAWSYLTFKRGARLITGEGLSSKE
jgi:NADH:ubiquinone reductase (H+-translocating)